MEQLGQAKSCRGLGCFPRLRMSLKAAATLFVLICCFVVAAMVWRFGFSLGKSQYQALFYGWLGVLGTVFKILLPFWLFAMGRKIYALLAQDDWQLRHGLAFVFSAFGVLAFVPIWFLCTSFSVTASLGFAAIQRADALSAMQQSGETSFLRAKHISEEMDFIPRFRPTKIVKQELKAWEKAAGLTVQECLKTQLAKPQRCQDRATLEDELKHGFLWQKLNQERRKLLARKGKAISDSIVASARTADEAPFEMVTILRPERTAYFLIMFLTLGIELVSAFGLFLLFGNKRLHSHMKTEE